jgi:transposase
VVDICREHGVCEATFYVWNKKYSGLALNELRELRAVARGERQAQAADGGFFTGPAYAAGDRAKKAPWPQQQRELGQWTQSFAEFERAMLRERTKMVWRPAAEKDALAVDRQKN